MVRLVARARVSRVIVGMDCGVRHHFFLHNTVFMVHHLVLRRNSLGLARCWLYLCRLGLLRRCFLLMNRCIVKRLIVGIVGMSTLMMSSCRSLMVCVRMVILLGYAMVLSGIVDGGIINFTVVDGRIINCMVVDGGVIHCTMVNGVVID